MVTTFVTGNKNKLREVSAILGPSFPLASKSIDLIEIQGTPREIVIDKCRRAGELIGGPTLVEDTCLSFQAFHHALPGPYIKSFLTALGLAGLPKILAAFPDKEARASCLFGYTAGPKMPIEIFEGHVQGCIVEPRGDTGFGWDAVFEVTERVEGVQGKTFGELNLEEKNRCSHRARALVEVKQFLEGLQ